MTKQFHQNATRVHNNMFGYRGVEWRADRKKFRAKIVDDGGRGRYLGTFDTAAEAATAYDAAAKDAYGDDAFLNFPMNGEKKTVPSMVAVGICAHGHSLAVFGRDDGRQIHCRECQRILAKQRYLPRSGSVV